MTDRRNRTARQQDAAHHLHPMTNPKRLAADGGMVFDRAEGIYLFTEAGDRLIDGLSGLACVNIGYGNDRLAEVAATVMRRLPYLHAFVGVTNPWAGALAEKLAEISPSGFERFFFATSGSEAVETAIKLAHYFWRLQGKPQKRLIIGRNLSYHGNTIVATSLTGISHYHPQFGLPLQGLVRHINAPYWFRHGGDLTPEQFAEQSADELDRAIKEAGPETVAAFIAEPIQGTGGMIVPPPGYWSAINRVCKKHDILLICDEVITGFGKTGHWFASETFGIEPDIITMAKGLSSAYLPISAVGIGARVNEALLAADEDFEHGFTACAHPVCAAVALENIKVIEDDRLIEHVRENLAPRLAHHLADIAALPIVGETRQCGVLVAIELAADKATRRSFPAEKKVGEVCAGRALEKGLIVRPIGDILGMSLPMITSEDQVDVIASIVKAAITDTARAL